MALQAGRTGVRKNQVDFLGRVKGGGSADTYTKTQIDTKLSAKQDAEKIGGLEFRDNEGQAQYKTPTGEWTNFSSGGDAPIGWNVPAELLTHDGLTFHQNMSNVEGGYYIKDNICFVNITFNINRTTISNNATLVTGLPHPTATTEGITVNLSDYKVSRSNKTYDTGNLVNPSYTIGNTLRSDRFQLIAVYSLV